MLGFSTQEFYKWKREPVTDREWNDAHLINAALEVRHDDPALGYRFVADELQHAGIGGSERRVRRKAGLSA
jgi:putative transposase